MGFFAEEISISTNAKVDVIDITDMVLNAIKKHSPKNGLLALNLKHTTCGITINEAESRLMRDIKETLLNLIPENKSYYHNSIDTNAHAHLRSSLLGDSKILPIINGKLSLGTWQRILLLESDGPRIRHLTVTFVGE